MKGEGNLKGKILAIIAIFALMISVSVPFQAANAKVNDTSRYGDVLDIGTKLRHLESDADYRANLDTNLKSKASGINFDGQTTAGSTGADSSFTYDGGTKYFLGYDQGGYYFKTYTLRSIGDKVEVWVANDLSFQDGRADPVVTQAQVDTLRDEFDNNIYQVDTDFFGTPDSHTGDNSLLSAWGYVPPNYYAPKDGKERVMMLVDNFRDENYYDSTYPFFVAGFYSSTFERYFDRNIISLDTNSWATRLENTYFGTTAHEFQHLIHNDNDSSEVNWINEGMSDFAEYLAGYGHPWGHINFFLDHPENSLVEWDEHYSAATGPETLADYGQAYLLQLYLDNHFGKEFIRALAKDKDHGIASMNKILAQFNTGIDFTELFKRFTVALAVDSMEPGNGIYNFNSIDLKVNYQSAAKYEKDGAPAWGGDYRVIDPSMNVQNINFDGINFMPLPWKVVDDPLNSGNQVLWGNNGNGVDNQLIFEADLSNVPSATLSFDNLIDIEEDWDAGMVQVSTDGGDTWQSLANGNTVDQSTFPLNDQAPQIYNNLPGFTGYSNGWVNESFDLTLYAGQKVLISFRYMTDMAYNDSGWFISNINIPEIGYTNAGSSLDGFNSIDQIKNIHVDYAVSFINEKSLGVGNNQQHYRVLNIDPFHVSEQDSITLKDFFSGGNNYMIIWYAAPIGKKGAAPYSYTITTKSDYNKNK